MGKKKVNPRRIPVTMADLNRAREQATRNAVIKAWAIMFTVLLDKEHADKEIMQRVWREVEDLSDAVTQGYVSIADLLNVLKVEYEIMLEG